MPAMTATTVGKNAERDAKSGAANAKVFYIALGTGTTAPSSGDTTLVTEVFRKAITTYAVGATGIITANVYIEPAEAVGIVVAEVGIFGGDLATETANTGTMLARVLYSPTHTKTSTESMVIAIQMQYS